MYVWVYVCMWWVCVCVCIHTHTRINLIDPLLRIIAIERQNKNSTEHEHDNVQDALKCSLIEQAQLL